MGLFKSKLLNDNHRAAVPVLVVTIGVLGCLSAMQLYSGEPIQNSPTVTNVSAPSGVFAAVMNDSEPLQVEGFKYQILRKRNIWERPTRLACGKRPGGYTCSQSTRYRPNGVFYELLFSTLDALKLRFFKYVPVAVKRVNKPVHILGWCVVVYYGQRWTRMALRFGLRLLAAVSETGTHGLGYMCGASVRVVWSLLVFVGVQLQAFAHKMRAVYAAAANAPQPIQHAANINAANVPQGMQAAPNPPPNGAAPQIPPLQNNIGIGA